MNLFRKIVKRGLCASLLAGMALFIAITPATASETTVAMCRDLPGQAGLDACAKLFNAGDTSVWIYLTYGERLSQERQHEHALQVYEAGIQRHPSDPTLRSRLEIERSIVNESGSAVRGAQSASVRDEVTRLRCEKLKKLGVTLPADCTSTAAPSTAPTINQPVVANRVPESTESTTRELPTESTDVAVTITPRVQTPAPQPAPSLETDSAAKTTAGTTTVSVRQPAAPSPAEPANTPGTADTPAEGEDIADIQRQLEEIKSMLEARAESASANDADATKRAESKNIVPDNRPRYALVVGNANYAKASQQLDSPINDAEDVSSTLRGLGFDVTLKTDVATQFEFESALLDHQNKLRRNPDSVGLVFYAGHAMQFDGMNYLIPTSTDIRGPQDVRAKTMSLAYIKDTLEHADNHLNMVVLDSCRDNPFRSFTRSNQAGLALMHPSTDGYLVIYAARPGFQALDSVGRNSPFTKHFLRSITESDEQVELMFKELARAVDKETNGEQTPWLEGQYLGEFVFKNVAAQ